MDFNGKTVAIIGVAKSGIAAARLLKKLGANIIMYDAKPKEAFAESLLESISDIGYEDMFGADIGSEIDRIDILVMSPGVPTDLPFIKKAQAMGKKVLAEIEIGFLTAKAEFVAITGTNGKTTTTDLTGVIFKNAGIHTFVLGNIGVPITQESINTKPGDVIVAETAALQMDTIETYRPHICAVLNVTEDHLNRYKTMENYTKAKMRIFENQLPTDFCLLNYDNDIARNMKDAVPSRVLYFSKSDNIQEGVFVRDGKMIFSFDGVETEIIDVDRIKIPGSHNLENALAAAGMAMLYGIDAKVIRDTLIEYPGVEHRIESVRTINGVEFINDSKATNPDATLKAVEAVKKPKVLMLGGSSKDNDFDPMFREFDDSVKVCVLLGETGPALKESADRVGFTRYVSCGGSFREAVDMAYSLADKGDAVLLSPACASFDMFEDFEHRGEVFKDIVKELS